MNLDNIEDKKVYDAVIKVVEDKGLTLEQIRDIGAVIMSYALFVKIEEEIIKLSNNEELNKNDIPNNI